LEKGVDFTIAPSIRAISKKVGEEKKDKTEIGIFNNFGTQFQLVQK